ncbi:MAG: hypothetical protein NZ518_09670 [Dehalococcoidia bacterium]|nr:hypothetical protein [Dehalococcoidia bacterium]
MQSSPTAPTGQTPPASSPSPTARPGQTPTVGAPAAGTPTPARTATPGGTPTPARTATPGGTPNITATLAAALTITPIVFGTPGASGTVVGACQFLTKADVDAVFNDSFTELGRSEAGGVSTCTYFAPGGRTVVLLARSGAVNEIRSAFDSARRFAGSEDVPNLGDEAFWSPGATQLHIRRGGLWLILTATAPAAEARQIHVQLGQRIIARVR